MISSFFKYTRNSSNCLNIQRRSVWLKTIPNNSEWQINIKGKTYLKISEEICFKMLELERETAATTNFHSGSTVYSWCVILITQHADENATVWSVFDQAWPTRQSRVESNFCYQRNSVLSLWTGATIMCGYLGSKRGQFQNISINKIEYFCNTLHNEYRLRNAQGHWLRQWRFPTTMN